jgi:phage tail sheath protein FI
MPEYLSPGVYVEEVDAGPKPIAGVSTSTAGAVGVTARGPTTGLPVLVTSYAEYVRRFGGVLPDPSAAVQAAWGVQNAEGGHWWKFPLAVKGFFDNGGQRLYVKRVAARTATSASATLGIGLVAHVTADAAATATQLKLEHLFDLENTTAVTLVNGDTLQPIGPGFTVASYDATASTVTLNAQVGAPILVSRGDFVQIHARSNPQVPANETTLRFTAKASGGWGNERSVRTRPVAEATLSLLPHPANGGAAASAVVQSTAGSTVTVNDATGFADGDAVLINGRQFTLSNVNQGADTFDVAPAIPAGANS